MKMFKLIAWVSLAFIALRVAEGDPDTPLATDDQNVVNLYQACDKDDLSEVKNQVAHGSSLDGTVGEYGFTPLIAATSKGNLDVVKYLIDYRAKIDLPDREGSTALLHACWENQTDCALALIDADANVNLASNAGRTPLMYAAKKGNDRVVQALIAHKAKLDQDCNEGPAIRWAVVNDNLSTVKLLCAAGADIELMPIQSAPDTYSTLGAAAAYGYADVVSYLLGQKANPDSQSDDGTTPLMAAAQDGYPQIIDPLLDNGAKINLQRKDGKTALMLACRYAHAKCVQKLVDRRADLDVADPQGETALTFAGDRGDVDLVDLLKSKGAKRTDVHIIAKKDPPQPLSPSHAWALAVSMIYTQIDGSNPKFLGGDRSADSNQSMLKKGWEIHDKTSLLRELDDLRDQGHHTEYREQGAKLAALTDDDFQKLLLAQPDNAARNKALRASYGKWKERTGLAWDICRSANLVNAGFGSGYLEQQEAWDRLLAIAREAQNNFSSWQEMSDNFLDGREIWAGKRDRDFEACAQLLLNPSDPNSPWNQNPWKTDLSGS